MDIVNRNFAEYLRYEFVKLFRDSAVDVIDKTRRCNADQSSDTS
jgi:hypothetical protein